MITPTVIPNKIVDVVELRDECMRCSFRIAHLKSWLAWVSWAMGTLWVNKNMASWSCGIWINLYHKWAFARSILQLWLNRVRVIKLWRVIEKTSSISSTRAECIRVLTSTKVLFHRFTFITVRALWAHKKNNNNCLITAVIILDNEYEIVKFTPVVN